jgi:hypothetical protein
VQQGRIGNFDSEKHSTCRCSPPGMHNNIQKATGRIGIVLNSEEKM